MLVPANVPQAQLCDHSRHHNIEASVLIWENTQSAQQAGYRARKVKEWIGCHLKSLFRIVK